MNEELKFQIPEVRLKGEYTVQLFDKNTGELIQEEKQHNVISKIPFSTAFFNHIYRGFLFNDYKYGIDGDGSSYSYLNWVMLTNDKDTPENDYLNPITFGECIGYAHFEDKKMYDDKKRGIINKNETKLIDNYKENGKKIVSKTNHIVWDFNTDRANGTFDNIYLFPKSFESDWNRSKDNSPNYYRGSWVCNDSLLISCEGNLKDEECDFNSDRGCMSHSEKYLYIQCFLLKNNQNGENQCSNKIAKINLENYNTEYITLQLPENKKNTSAYIVYACGYFWRIEYNYQTTRYNLNGEYVDTINLLEGVKEGCYYIGRNDGMYMGDPCTKYASNRYINFTGDDEYLYIGYLFDYKENEKDFSKLYTRVLDSKGRVVKDILRETLTLEQRKKITDNTFPFCLFHIFYINNEKYLICSKIGDLDPKIYMIKNGDFIEKNYEMLNYFFKWFGWGKDINSSSYTQAFFSKDGNLFVMSSGDKNVYWGGKLGICNFIPWGSHCKLNKPIIKTEANTMKIKYDVTIERILPCTIPNALREGDSNVNSVSK